MTKLPAVVIFNARKSLYYHNSRNFHLMTEKHFSYHLLPFRIHMHFLLFHKIATDDHFGNQKITFDHIDGQFKKFGIFFTTWPPATSLDVHEFRSHFRHYSDQYANLSSYFHKMLAIGHRVKYEFYMGIGVRRRRCAEMGPKTKYHRNI